MGKLIELKTSENTRKEVIKVNIKLAKAILFLLVEGNEPIYKTKLNKLLFYAQFLYAKRYGGNLIGKEFIKDFYGPAIEDLDYELKMLCRQNLIELNNNGYGTIIYPKARFKDENYTCREREVLQTVIERFRGFTASDITEQSHTEPLWIDGEMKQVIPLNQANKLIEFIR